MNIKTLLPELKKLVTELSEDLLARSTATAEVDAGLREAYTQIEKGGRTADAFEVWREDYLDQVAVAWVLSCVFVRFMEDNHLIDECWLAGEGERRKLAEDAHELYFRENPRESDREYFEHVFHEVGKIPACRDLFAEGKTPLWAVGPSGDAAMRLLAFWKDVVPETGQLKRSFNHEIHETHETHEKDSGSSFRVFSVFRGCSPDSDPTRFLGDLYQDLSERARKKYALLQTPVFVEEFILDRTLNPAIDEFGLDEVRMIDPTCGSGHFLLGSFARLFDLWIKREDNDIVAAQKALDGVWGVDINPFAVAIARFRLIVAALYACNIRSLKKAPAWNIHLATGDSLLFGQRWDRSGQAKGQQLFLATEEEGSWAPEVYACEDREAINQVLGQQYHAVVGNPPYITVKDKALNQAYRNRYATCHRQYSLAVPFMERFFDLSIGEELTTKNTNDTKRKAAGYVGQITANSFMKREFGKKLIEQYFATIDLTHVIDTSGAYIPGHGTPTVILFGRNRPPQQSSVRAVLGIKGEPSTPPDPSQGKVWQSIVRHIDVADAQDAFTSTADVPRATFTSHPWSIGGGGAANLQELIEAGCQPLRQFVEPPIGRAVRIAEEDIFMFDTVRKKHSSIAMAEFRQFLLGERVRDWRSGFDWWVWYPYFGDATYSKGIQLLWRWKTTLANRSTFQGVMCDAGREWYEYMQHTASAYRTPLSIAFAFVSTHNHFVLDRGGKVFNRSAPIIKLPAEATEDDHLALLGLLNSSTACFWMRQVGSDKGMSGGIVEEKWERHFMFNGTQIGKLPICNEFPLVLTRHLDQLAQQYSALLPDQLLSAGEVPTRARLESARGAAELLRAQMIALQEELDWQCYELYGLVNHEKHEKHEIKQPLFYQDLFRVFRDFRGCSLGQRAFEIVMARQMAAGELDTKWFTRHGSTPISEIPVDWPEEYRQLVEGRIELIETSKEIALIERPEYKRRWNTESWDDQQQRALKHWLLDRLETGRYWPDLQQHEPRLQSVAGLADRAASDQDLMQVAAIYRDRDDFDLAALIAELVQSESVPSLPISRYKPPGLRKRAVWERTWELQREEDRLTTTNHTNEGNEDRSIQESESSIRAIRDIRGSLPAIPVPPKYTSADFLKSDFWRLRGKLDVPKERWISFPHCETEGDPSLVVGWAGWNHLQQGTAIVAYYDARKNEGWTAERLIPLLAGLDQLLPWIHQWHPEIDSEYNETAGTSFQTLLESEAQELGLTLEQIRNWTPPAKKKAAKKTASKQPRKTRTTRTTRKKAAATEAEDNLE